MLPRNPDCEAHGNAGLLFSSKSGHEQEPEMPKLVKGQSGNPGGRLQAVDT
jgi:hypothetical protein